MPTIEGFEEFTEIGRGGFGVVYRARQPALNRYVAIKVLGATLDSSGRERLSREALAMGALSGHPNIVSVVDVGIPAKGEPYLVMPYLAHGSLADVMATRGTVPWTEAARIGVKLAGALESAHRLGILHRDVKPGNILLSDFDEPQLADFGLARVSGGFQTTSRHITASVSHAAPEILDGKPPSAAADIYSLASTLFALVAGGPAFSSTDDESLVALYVRIASAPVPDLTKLGVPARFHAALAAAMSKDQRDRPASAEAFGRMLQQVEAAEGVPVTELPIKEPSPALAPVGDRPAAIASGPTRVAKPVRPRDEAATPVWRRPRMAAIATVVAVVAAGAVYVAMRDDDSSDSSDSFDSFDSTTASAISSDITCLEFPEDVPWYQTIEDLPLHPDSDAYTTSIEDELGFESGTFRAGFDSEGGGALVNVVTGSVADQFDVTFSDSTTEAESDPGPYVLPADTAYQDDYALVLDDDTCTSYELYGTSDPPWESVDGAGIFELNAATSRPVGRRSAIQSGLPMLPMLVRYDEAASGEIAHALFFNSPTQSTRFMAPATRGGGGGGASDDPALPPLGSRFRLRADFDCNELVTSEGITICETLQSYGMYLGGSSGSFFVLQGAGDSRWTDEIIDDMEFLEPSDFEVVDTGETIETIE